MVNISTQPTPVIATWASYNHSDAFTNSTPKPAPPTAAENDAMPTAVWVLVLVLIMLFLTEHNMHAHWCTRPGTQICTHRVTLDESTWACLNMTFDTETKHYLRRI